METLGIILAVFLGVVVGILFLGGILYLKVKSMVPKEYRDEVTIRHAFKEGKEIAQEERSRAKNASGITNLLVPQIRKDFSDFNETQFFELVERNLRTIFNIIEKKDISLLTNDLEPLRGNLTEKVRDLLENDISITYDDVVFHKHALRSYTKDHGVATLVISSSLEYYYYYKKGDKYIEKKDYKKQTRYLSTLAYIYDKEKAKTSYSVIGLNCPNCGAPLDGFQQTKCKFCGTHTIELDLKSWKFISYKED